jgi:IS5 family transposase
VSGLIGASPGAETKVWGDTAYQGQTAAIRAAAPAAQDMTHRRGSRGHPLSDEERAKGKHPLVVIKRIFGFTHVRYRGLAKKRARFEVLCALANLYMTRVSSTKIGRKAINIG